MGGLVFRKASGGIALTLLLMKIVTIARLDVCALNKDLEILEFGDKTEVGEKGIAIRWAVVRNSVLHWP